MKTTKVAAAILIFIALGIGTIPTLGATSSDPAECGLKQEKFGELKSIRENPALDYAQATKQELELRKELLRETLGCITKEAADMKSKLDDVNTSDDAAKKIKVQLSRVIEDAIGYYGLQKTQIDNLGLQGSKDFSKNLLAWREGNYKPAAQLASNFIIWSENQNVFETASIRIDQVKRTVELLRVAKIDDYAKIQNLWTGIQGEFDGAARYNQRAEESILSFAPADESSELIKLSLRTLSDTYNKLFELMKTVSESIAH
ncbi:MAG: hypothetical protein AAB655_01735 [Patescibacteria group bacterium]